MGLLSLGLVDVAAVVLTVYLIVRVATSSRTNLSNLPLPPGPPRLPVLGNAHQIPMEGLELAFAAWGKQYGDVVLAKMFNTPMLVLNSFTAAQDLMDKRSGKYSDRPELIVPGQLLGWNSTLQFMHYGAGYRKHRKWIADGFSSRAALQTYRHVQQRETYTLVAGLIAQPDAFKKHIERWATGMIIDITYGHRVRSLDDKYVKIANDALEETAKATTPLAMLVDFVPIMAYLPSWVPGAGFKRTAFEGRKIVRRLMDTPYEMVKTMMAEGTAGPSFTASLIESAYANGGPDASVSPEEEEDMKGAGAGVYAAGIETTVTSLTSFLFAMVRNPHVFRKAQQEVDAVVGQGRLPDFTDRERLPYVECVLKEVFRWNAPLRLGLPHRLTADDEHLGYRIPEGSIVMPNIWHMTRDSACYDSPEDFIPERFLESKDRSPALDPRKMIFGFGRRICPGMEFADASLFLAISCILAALDIGKAVDADGNEITPPQVFTPGLTSHPQDFVCAIRPRSEKVADLVTQMCAGMSS